MYLHVSTITGCEPKRIWSLVRHGTRNPNRKTIRLMVEELLAIRSRLIEAQDETPTMCNEDVRLFEEWIPNVSVEFGLI